MVLSIWNAPLPVMIAFVSRVSTLAKDSFESAVASEDVKKRLAKEAKTSLPQETTKLIKTAAPKSALSSTQSNISAASKTKIAAAIIVLVASAVIVATIQNADSAATAFYWIVLGIASSIGLGTGLHTFVLFLAPFIAKVANAALACHSTSFYTRGPHAFVCQTSINKNYNVNLASIYSLVVVETMCWGLGTAIGELPPYFLARAASIAGGKDSHSILDTVAKPNKTSFEELQTIMHKIVVNLGFFGILLCASVPNPLFDLAGIICGHFNVPFWTFFGATVIGKAIIKCNLQSFAVLLFFSTDVREVILQNIKPILPPYFYELIVSQTLGMSDAPKNAGQTGIIGYAWNTFLACTVSYFIISIIESLGLEHIRREKIKDDEKKD